MDIFRSRTVFSYTIYLTVTQFTINSVYNLKLVFHHLFVYFLHKFIYLSYVFNLYNISKKKRRKSYKCVSSQVLYKLRQYYSDHPFILFSFMPYINSVLHPIAYLCLYLPDTLHAASELQCRCECGSELRRVFMCSPCSPEVFVTWHDMKIHMQQKTLNLFHLCLFNP